jgi:JmjC domain
MTIPDVQRVSDLYSLARAVGRSLQDRTIGYFTWVDGSKIIPITTSIVQTWLEGGEPRLPGFGLVRDGMVADPSEICRKANVRGTTINGFPSVEKFERKLKDGYSLVFSSMEAWSPEFATFLADFERAFQAETLATCVLSPPAARAFPLHEDPEDVIVVQLEGSKHWSIRVGEERAEICLNRNDVLYLPPGVPHEVVGGSQGSLHVTFGLRPEPLPAAVGRYFRTLILDNVSDPRSWSSADYAEAIRKVGEIAGSGLVDDKPGASPSPAQRARRFAEPLSRIVGLP